MSHFCHLLVATLLVFSSSLSYSERSPIEVYGSLPEFRSLSISPDGEHYAYIQRVDTADYFVVTHIESRNIVAKIPAKKLKARSTYFATNEHVLLRASDTSSTFGFRGRRERSGALVYNIRSNEVRLLLKKTKYIHPAQTGLGKIVGLHERDEKVYMPAFHWVGAAAYNLYKVDLNTGRGRLHARGTANTIDWFVGNEGLVLAREQYDEEDKEHRIQSKVSGKWKTIYSAQTSIPEISVQAVATDEKSLLFIDKNDDREAVYSMSLKTGEVLGPLYSKDDTDIDYLETTINRKLSAIVYSGFKPKYEFVDAESNALYKRLELTFPKSSIYVKSSTKNNEKVIIRVDGGGETGSYILFDSAKSKLYRLAAEYDVVSVGPSKAIKYNSRDGLKIPAIITFPPGDTVAKDLPLIVLPHGGPESYDRIGFNWLSQFFAVKGYVVLQPNFRGSTGFGYEFRNAGRGRWGREMQDDVSDGIKRLVSAGYVNPDRVCIVGGSYGGYSALIGGAFNPELYRCIVAINGVADIPLMMKEKSQRYGRDHWVLSYWDEVIGDRKEEREKLKNISPVNFASSFQSPVLLIHGKDDTVVPIKQSREMQESLAEAGKAVEFIELDGEDHWLSTSTSRVAALRAIDAFLDKHNPTDDL